MTFQLIVPGYLSLQCFRSSCMTKSYAEIEFVQQIYGNAVAPKSIAFR